MSSMVRVEGLEPPLPFGNQILHTNYGFRRHPKVFVVWTFSSPFPVAGG